jgi:hypothetical protein
MELQLDQHPLLNRKGEAYSPFVSHRTLALLVLLSVPIVAQSQDDSFRLTVRGYQWTTTHRTLTFTWPGYANTSCNGTTNVNGYVAGNGNFTANATDSTTCSTTYTPPSSENIDIQKPVVFILADTDSSRMVLTCTRNVRWSQCHALNPGSFRARNDKGHFEVQALFGKGKEEWVKFDIVQQTAISPLQPQETSAREAPASIEAPKSATADANGEFPARWKSMINGSVRTLRFGGEYIYGELVLTDAAAKAGAFALMDVKKDGDKYVGKINTKIVSRDGKSCSLNHQIELTLVGPDRIEGRSFTPPANAKVDWATCTFSPPAEWRDFTWIPVR